MKKILLFALLGSMFSFHTEAQEKSKSDAVFHKNNVKINLFALPLKNFSLQYERGLTPHLSVCMGVRFQPNSNLPFKSSVSSMIGDDTTAKDFVNNTKMGSWGITPEVRYYFGKKPLNGFYVAPFLRVGGNNMSWNYAFDMDNGKTKDVAFRGNMNSVFGGLLLGAQWHVGSSFLIDWWILGPSYGSINVKLNANGDFSDLSAQDRADLQESLSSIGYNGHKVESEITNDHITAKVKLPMLGLRTGLCVGYTF